MEKISEEMRREIVETLLEMISIPTVVPPGDNYKEFVDYAGEIFKNLGMKTRIVKVPKKELKNNIPDMVSHPRYILLARMGKGKPILHFNGHYDVVPASEGWKFDAFKAFVRDNRVYGRGASDMKGGIASIIAALKIVENSDVVTGGTIELSLTPDEEIGGRCGTKYMLNTIEKPDWAVIAEPSDCSNIWIGHKGAIWGEIKVIGKAAHASTPELGVNAVEECVRVAGKLMEFGQKVKKRKTSYECAVKNATLTITKIKGGIKVNMVPDSAILTFDRRIIPEESLEDAKDEIESLVGDVEFNVIFSVSPSINTKSALASQIASIADKEGIKVKKAISSGFMDTRFFIEAGVDTIAFGPGKISLAHAPGEYVVVEDVLTVGRIFAGLIGNLLGRS